MMAPERTAAPSAGNKLVYAGGVVLVLLLAAALRMYRLGGESAWWDEYLVVGFMQGHNLDASWRVLRFWNFDNAFLYHVLCHLWYQVVGAELFGLRMFSVAFGVATIAALMHYVRGWSGATAALLAGTLVALSPAHIWFSQALRPYSVFLFFAVISIFTLPAIHDPAPSRRRFLHHAANFGMLLTHPFTIFLLAAEGIYLCLVRTPIRTIVQWSVLCVLFALPTAVLLLDTLQYVFSPESDHFVMPPFRDVLMDIVADDAFAVSTETWLHRAWFPFGLAETDWLAVCRFAEWTLVGFGVLTIAMLLWAMLRGKAADRQHATLLLLVIVLPALLLFGLSWVWRPIAMPRYTLYGPLVLYVAFAWSGVRLGRVAAVLLGVPLIAALSVVTLDLSLSNTRTNWHAAARDIEARGNSWDLITMQGVPPFATDMLAFHLRDGRQVARSLNVGHATRAIVNHLQSRASQNGSIAWGVYDLTYVSEEELREAYQTTFSGSGVTLDFSRYDGMSTLFMVRVEATPAFDPMKVHMSPDPLAELEARAAVAPDTVDIPAILGAVGIPFPDFPTVWYVLSMMLVDQGYPQLAVICAQYALDQDPNYALGNLAMCTARAALGEVKAATPYLERATAGSDILVPAYVPFFEAVLNDGDPAGAQAALDNLAPLGFPHEALAAAFRAVFPDAPSE